MSFPERRSPTMQHVLINVADERERQDAKWGEQNHPDGTGSEKFRRISYEARLRCEQAFADGTGTWAHIFLEEVCEALAEGDQVKLREELVQATAVAVAWIEAIDRSRA